jgi:hypothetical protein
MKKVLSIVAIATLVACGGASTTATTDSTATTVDSTVVATDSTVVQIPADSTSTGGGSLTRPGKEQPEHVK